MKKKLFALLALALIASMLMSSALAYSYVESSATVNVRKGPGLSYSSLGRIYEGDVVDYLDKTSIDDRGVLWYKVEFEDRPGWVSSKYCELFGDIYIYAVEGQSYIRKYPNLDGKALAIMHEEEYAEYLGKTSVDERGVAWYKVDFDGTIGWVSSKYTRFGEEEYDRVVIADDGQSYIRDYPDLEGEALAIFRQDESATYLEKSSRDDRGVIWYKVEYDGTIGWVSSKYSSVY